MKDLLRLLVTIAILAFVIRFALENVRPGYNIAAGTDEATLNYYVKETGQYTVRATAVAEAEPGGRIWLDVNVQTKRCGQAEAYRKPSTPSRLQAEKICPPRTLKADQEYVFSAVVRRDKADPAKVELVVEKAD